jgi:Na+/phosphate symporter
MTSDSVTRAADVDRAEEVAMAGEVVEMLRLVQQAFSHLDARRSDEAARIGHLVHQQERGLLGRLGGRGGAARPGGHVPDDVVFVPTHLERLADHVGQLASATSTVVQQGTLFTDRAVHEISGLLESAVEILEGVRDALRTGNHVLIRYVIEAGRACETRANEYALFHEKRLVEGVCEPRSSSVYLAMLEDIKGVEWHARQIAQQMERRGADDGPWSEARHRRVDGL